MHVNFGWRVAAVTDPALKSDPREAVKVTAPTMAETREVFEIAELPPHADEPDTDGWIVARIAEVPGAMSQGRTRDEARENVIDALRLMLAPDNETDARSSEPLERTFAE